VTLETKLDAESCQRTIIDEAHLDLVVLAHYVTEVLDAGPIIEQDVQRVDHRHTPDDLRRLGRQIERVVLARAVRWHAEDPILVHTNQTVVFS
jgi:formyltetrahydrofolate deformylase